MQDKESGSLSQKPALELIVELYRGAVTGSLKLERAPLQKAVYFRDGQILFAASNDPKDQLASILVEEGKLGPDQMQVAQARVSSGNPLAKVLTELGYISQRELADAARIKVEKILTDLYTWVEGNYQFATKSLPKGAIDLDLSTPQLIYSSIRRIQNREWILQELGSLETVLAPTDTLENVIQQTLADPESAEVLRLADGVKTVQQIGALSSLGEFDVCKILVAGLIVGGLTKAGAPQAAGVAAAEEAFSIPTDEPAFSPPPSPGDVPALGGLGGAETVGLPTSAPPAGAGEEPFAPADATVFEAPAENEKTVFDPSPPPLEPPPPPQDEPSSTGPELPGMQVASGPTASELLIDEPEPEDGEELSIRTPPRPRGMRRGGRSSSNLSGILKIAAVLVLAAGAAFAFYRFAWPLIGSSGSETDRASGPVAAATTAPPSLPPRGSASTSPRPKPPSPAQGAGPKPADPRQTTPSAAPGPRPPQPATSTTPATTTARRTGPSPPKPDSAGKTRVPGPETGGSARQLLEGGNLPGAAREFLKELRRGASSKFTIAVGLYCNEDNVSRLVRSARGSDQLYLLPTTLEGRRCYRVLWGVFDTRGAAEKGKDSLPNGIRAGDAAAVPLAGLLR